MSTNDLILQLQDCACLLYQNSEQEAYAKINLLLPPMNQTLQTLTGGEEATGREVLLALSEFIEAYQVKDNLALADLLGYHIPAILNTTEA